MKLLTNCFVSGESTEKHLGIAQVGGTGLLGVYLIIVYRPIKASPMDHFVTGTLLAGLLLIVAFSILEQ